MAFIPVFNVSSAQAELETCLNGSVFKTAVQKGGLAEARLCPWSDNPTMDKDREALARVGTPASFSNRPRPRILVGESWRVLPDIEKPVALTHELAHAKEAELHPHHRNIDVFIPPHIVKSLGHWLPHLHPVVTQLLASLREAWVDSYILPLLPAGVTFRLEREAPKTAEWCKAAHLSKQRGQPMNELYILLSSTGRTNWYHQLSLTAATLHMSELAHLCATQAQNLISMRQIVCRGLIQNQQLSKSLAVLDTTMDVEAHYQAVTDLLTKTLQVSLQFMD